MNTIRNQIDCLIEERASWITIRGRFFGRFVRNLIYKLLNYDRTVRVAEHLNQYSGRKIFDIMGRYLAKRVNVEGLHHIPKEGAAIIVSNHPTGIADGLILHHIINKRRRDNYFLANRDILRLYPQLNTMIAPVEWRQEKRGHNNLRETLNYIKDATQQNRLAVVFPSGRLAKRNGLRLNEREWMHSALMLAIRYNLPVIPIHISARNSVLFYLCDLIHPSLRDITLFHETLNKRHMRFTVKVGDFIPAEQLDCRADISTRILKSKVEALGRQKKTRFGWKINQTNTSQRV